MASSSKTVRFGEEIIVAASDIGDNDEDNDESEYFEIFTSEAESYGTSDEESELLQMALEGAYICSPSKTMLDPAERSSYLLFDKDLMEQECDDEIGKCEPYRVFTTCVYGICHVFMV